MCEWWKLSLDAIHKDTTVNSVFLVLSPLNPPARRVISNSRIIANGESLQLNNRYTLRKKTTHKKNHPHIKINKIRELWLNR